MIGLYDLVPLVGPQIALHETSLGRATAASNVSNPFNAAKGINCLARCKRDIRCFMNVYLPSRNTSIPIVKSTLHYDRLPMYF